MPINSRRSAQDISIHAPREGRDHCTTPRDLYFYHFNPRAPRGARLNKIILIARLLNFNPRAPRGARQNHNEKHEKQQQFQSTRPARGATSVTAGMSIQI